LLRALAVQVHCLRARAWPWAVSINREVVAGRAEKVLMPPGQFETACL